LFRSFTAFSAFAVFEIVFEIAVTARRSKSRFLAFFDSARVPQICVNNNARCVNYALQTASLLAAPGFSRRFSASANRFRVKISFRSLYFRR
jgi:hypothetical protein